MAQPALTTKNPLGIAPFWQKASAEPPTEWEKWNQQLYLGIVAKDGINLQKLLRDPPAIRKPHEPGYELPIEGETQSQTRDRNIRNQEKKIQWDNQCAQLDNLGPTVDGIPWEEADIKVKSYIYLSLGNEGQRRLNQPYPDLKIQEISTRAFWDRLEHLFIKDRNVTFDRYEAFTRKQNKTETLEQFHCGLTELVIKGNFKCPNCNNNTLETEIIRDLFTANMTNDEVQKDLLAETKTPEQAFEYAIRREKGLENQIQIRKQGSSSFTSQHTGIKTEPVGFIQRRGGDPYRNNRRGNNRGRGQPQRGSSQRPDRDQKQSCFKCGNPFGPSHLQQCPARDKICNKCTKRGHYARLCKSTNVNAISEETNPEVNIQDTDIAAYVDYLQAGDIAPGWELIHPEDNSVNAVHFEEETAGNLSTNDLKGHLIRVRIGNHNITFIADTGSPTSFVNNKTGAMLESTVPQARRMQLNQNDEANRMVCYNGYKIPAFGRLIAPIESGGWTINTAPFVVVDDKRANILGRNLLPQLGIHLQQEKPTGKSINYITKPDQSDTAITNWVKSTYPGLCTRIGRSKNHVVHTKFLHDFKALQQKGRRIPIHIQEKVEQELKSLIDQGHIVKLDSCSDKQFISPIVITVKKDYSIKLAMDSKQINKAIHKNKYQMPNIDVLLDNVAQSAQEGTGKPGTTYFSTIDLRYAYSQLKLDEKTKTQCNFSIIGGQATGTYQFQTGFYGLTDMPAEFQKAIDLTLNNEKDTFAFLDDILIISHGTKEQHIDKLKKVLDKLDQENMAISLNKCKFGCKEVEWLGFIINEFGTIPIHKKTEAITNLQHPKTFKQLKSFMGSIHHLNKFIPNLAQLCTPLRPLLSSSSKFHFMWNQQHEEAFQIILKAVRNITENRHFVSNRETRIVCDASREGIGAALEQETPDGWATVAYASRFLNACENKYSVNELELLAAVWAIDHFKYYLYGRRFTLITDHQALVSALNSNKSNKTYQSRLTRWIDRLIPFDFDIKHLSGSKMGLIDYISRHPVGKPQPPAYWDEHFVVALIDDFISCLEFQDSTIANIEMNKNPNGSKHIAQLDRNENANRSNSLTKETQFTVNDHSLSSSHSLLHSKLSNCSNLSQSHLNTSKFYSTNSNSGNQPPIQTTRKKKTSSIHHHQQLYAKLTPPNPVTDNMSRQLQTGMSLPPFKRILRKCHSGQQTNLSIPPTKVTSLNEFSEEPGRSTLSFSDVRYQIIPSKDSFTFERKSDQICQTEQTEEQMECQAISMEDEDVPLFRKNLRKALDVDFIAAATKRDRNLQPLINMIRNQKWDQIKACYGPYFYNVRDRLSVRDNVLLYDDRVIIPKQLRQIIIDSIHLTHPGQGSMLEAAKHIWYPFLHRDIVTAAQNCKECRTKGKNLRVISGKKHFTNLDAVVEPNEEIQLDFAGPLPDENKKDVYILVGVDRFSRFPYAKVVTNNKADTIIRFMQTHLVNQGVPRNIRCDQAQGFRAKKFRIYCNSNNIKLIFAPVDDHRSMGMVERLIRTLKTRLSIMKIDKNNTPYKLASDVAELIKTLRITPHATTKITPFEAHYGRKPNTPLTNICTTPKISNLSWENTKLSCLDEKMLTKPALTPEAIWNREANSEDELDVVYKPTYLPEPLCEPAGPSSMGIRSKTIGQRQTPPETKKHISLSDTDEDEQFDQALLRKFPIGAHLPLNNIPYDLQKVKRSFLAENPKHDIANIRTRKPIRWLTQQEKHKLEKAPLVFLKDRFKGPQNTIDPALGKRLEQVARKSGTIARKTKNAGVFGPQFKVIENGSIINYSPHTAWVREDGKQPRVIRHDGLAFVPDPRVTGNVDRLS